MADVNFTSLVTSLITCHHWQRNGSDAREVFAVLELTQMDSSNTVRYAKDCRNKSGLHSNVLRYCIHDDMIINRL